MAYIALEIMAAVACRLRNFRFPAALTPLPAATTLALPLAGREGGEENRGKRRSAEATPPRGLQPNPEAQ